VNQALVAVPMMALYMIGVLVAWLFGKAERPDDSVTA